MLFLQVAVDPTWRRRGIAGRLVDATLAELWARRARWVALEVRASNAPALRLYGRRGFETRGRRRSYYADGEDALVLGVGL